MIGHGRSNASAVKHGIRVAAEFFTSDVNARIEGELALLDARQPRRSPGQASA